MKYIALAVTSAGILAALQQTSVLSAVNEAVGNLLDLAARFGVPGMLLAGFFGNASIFIQIPYTLPLLSVALAGATLPDLMVLAIACGVGAGAGELVSYKLADMIRARTPDIANSSIYRWIVRNTEHHPVLTHFAVFVWAVTPLPDDTVVVPLAMVNYGLRRIALPLFAGKIVHNVVIALAFFWFAEQSAAHASSQVTADVALLVIVAFVLVVLYQVEATRHTASSRAGDDG